MLNSTHYRYIYSIYYVRSRPDQPEYGPLTGHAWLRVASNLLGVSCTVCTWSCSSAALHVANAPRDAIKRVYGIKWHEHNAGKGRQSHMNLMLVRDTIKRVYGIKWHEPNAGKGRQSHMNLMLVRDAIKRVYGIKWHEHNAGKGRHQTGLRYKVTWT